MRPNSRRAFTFFAVAALSAGHAGVLALSASAIGSPATVHGRRHAPRCEQISIMAPTANADVRGIEALALNYAWLVGRYRDGQGNLVPWTAHWNGSAWSDVGAASMPQGTLNGVAGTPGTHVTFAVGDDGYSPTIERWDGAAWNQAYKDDANGGSLYGVAMNGPNDVWAVGGSTYPQIAPISYHWDGSNWHRVHVPIPGGYALGGLDAVAILSPSEVWAVGWAMQYQSYYDPVSLWEHWDGQRWTGHLVFHQHINSTLNALTAVPHDRSVWAVGYTGRAALHTLAARFAQGRWSRVRSPKPAMFSSFSGIAALNASNIWAVGYAQQVTVRPLIEQWDGAVWQHVEGAPQQQMAELTSASAIPGTSRIWAAGYTLNRSATGALVEQCLPRYE